MTFTLSPHEHKQKAGDKFNAGERHRSLQVRHYVRIQLEGSPPVFIQDGKYFWEGGEVIKPKDMPKGIQVEVDNMTEQARRDVGLNG